MNGKKAKAMREARDMTGGAGRQACLARALTSTHEKMKAAPAKKSTKERKRS